MGSICGDLSGRDLIRYECEQAAVSQLKVIITLASWDVSLYDTIPVHTKLPIINKPHPPLLTSQGGTAVCAPRPVTLMRCFMHCVRLKLIHTSGNLKISM